MIHPNVLDKLSVAETRFWGLQLTSGKKVIVGFEERDLLITNVAVRSGNTGSLQVTSDAGAAVVAKLSEAAPSSKVWFRVMAGQKCTLHPKGEIDVLGYSVVCI